MIWTVFKISALRLWNNKQELALAFALPVLFFSLFALVFSRGIGQPLSSVRVSFVDDDRTPESLAMIRAACQHAEIRPVTGLAHTHADWPIDRLARTLISRENAEVVVHIPAGFTTQDPQAPHLSIGLLNEGTNQIAHRLVQACLAEAIAMQFAEANMQSALQSRPQFSLASARRSILAEPTTSPRPSLPTHSLPTHSRPADGQPADGEPAEPQVFQSVNAFASNKHQPRVAMYAAGIAVMFLLFSASGTGASLLEEREAGTLNRLLSSRLNLTQLLLGKWFYMSALGVAQLGIMFLWGQLVFGVDLLGHLPGFVAIAGATSAASSSFALFLASICRSRQQLHAMSVVLILSMSAVGGSMIPRYIMSDSMKNLGKFTFNGWALDGFQKVFWYDLPIAAIRLELGVLLSITLILGIAARLLAQRWGAT